MSQTVPPLEQLARMLELRGHSFTMSGGQGLSIFQENAQSYAYYEVIPWRADPRVPVLYFSIYAEDPQGTVRPLSAAAAAVEASKWVSQTEHPLTSLPVMFIHPCHTQDWLNDTGGDWFLWLQYFGRKVGLLI